MNVAYRIMACKEREDMVKAELAQLDGCDVKVFFDDREDRSDRRMTSYTQMKCINDVLADMNKYSHICILQDDVRLVNDFDACMKKLISHRPHDLWTLFCPRIKDIDFERPYTRLKPANTWGQGNLISVFMLENIVEYRKQYMPYCAYDDGVYWCFLQKYGLCAYTTNVALLQHLCPTDSTLGYNNKNKISKVWAGEDVIDKINWRCMDEKERAFRPSTTLGKEERRWSKV